ncbi:heme-binding protein [Nonomuraea sp. FMUSA5-5]|uniref:Heme-binding protein n=1 Tax=Nonomuraea composti TaxID=2720023 RepID=A0ABX1B0F2_9ACTN|nr:heme-binding protein [Nonomuraea sp. FMUSA5-5]NJP88483.1 heme-binding protein [Nonomuraea sp. FMUSA5-5]
MQHTIQRPSVSHAAAQAVVEAAVRAAQGTPVAYAVAVVDAGGHLTAFARMDGAPVMAIQVAQDKAYTAAGFGMSTERWHEFIKDDAPLALGAPAGVERLVAFGGGVPIILDGHVVGGVGVCGGHWSDDVKIAEAGLAALDR